jgi:hypothetical protein
MPSSLYGLQRTYRRRSLKGCPKTVILFITDYDYEAYEDKRRKTLRLPYCTIDGSCGRKQELDHFLSMV